MYLTIKKSIFLLLCCICIVSFTETNKKSATITTAPLDVMKSDVLMDEALIESGNILTLGQQLADEGKSIEDIVKTFPEGAIFQTNNTAILFFIEGSIPMVIELDNNSTTKNITKGGGGFTNASLKTQTSSQLSLSSSILPASFYENEELVGVIGRNRNDDERQKKKALILAPFNNTDFKGKDDADVAYKYLKENRNFKDNILFRKENITLEDFMSFDKYDLVHLSTHGQVFCNPLKQIKDGVVEIINGDESNYCHTLISTNIKHGLKFNRDKVKFKKEILKKYGEKFDGLIAWSEEVLYLTGTFFDNTYNELENKIWIFSACETGVRSDLSESMKRIHTNSHYFSWLYSVHPNDAYKAFDEFYKNLIIKGLDAEKAFEKIPIALKENLPVTSLPESLKDTLNLFLADNEKLVVFEREVPVELPESSNDSIEITTSLLHLQTDDPRHGIEVIDMLHPKNEQLVQQGDFYELTGDFNDGIDEEITIKVKLLGYTKAEFIEKQMSLSLEVDGDLVLSKQAFLPDVSGDNSTVEDLTTHEYGVMVTITEIAIPDVGTKEELTLKATLHLNEEHVSIHKETVSILSQGIIATTKQRGRKSKYTYDGKRKTGKYEVGSNPAVLNDDQGYSYMHTKGTGWIKVNMRRMTGTNAEYDEKTTIIMNYPLVGFALTYKIKDIEASNKFKKTKVDCGFPVKCSQYSAKGVKLTFNPSGKLIEYEMPKQTIHYTYGKYDVILPEAVIPAKVKELEKVMSRLKIGGQ